jgi:hypothetical protein
MCKAAKEHGIELGVGKIDPCHAWKFAECKNPNGLYVEGVSVLGVATG